MKLHRKILFPTPVYFKDIPINSLSQNKLAIDPFKTDKSFENEKPSSDSMEGFGLLRRH